MECPFQVCMFLECCTFDWRLILNTHTTTCSFSELIAEFGFLFESVTSEATVGSAFAKLRLHCKVTDVLAAAEFAIDTINKALANPFDVKYVGACCWLLCVLCVVLCTAVWCCVLLCTAVYCCVLLCTAVYCFVRMLFVLTLHHFPPISFGLIV